jgi:hypothetical protein
MGGIIAKYFPLGYSFSEKKWTRILASAIQSREFENGIGLMIKEWSQAKT